MAKLAILGAVSLDANAANAVVGDTTVGLTAVGATQITALALPSVNNHVSVTAAGTGVILSPGSTGDIVVVYNGGANALTVYPPVGGTLNALAVNTGLAIATVKSGIFLYAAPTVIVSILSA